MTMKTVPFRPTGLLEPCPEETGVVLATGVGLAMCEHGNVFLCLTDDSEEVFAFANVSTDMLAGLLKQAHRLMGPKH